MKRSLILTLSAIAIFAFAGCNTTLNSTGKKVKLSAQAGLNKGGITENTDMSVVSSSGTAVDAFSGATNTGFNAGIRASYPLKRNEIETGIDFMLNKQTFTYNDKANEYVGQRMLNVSQIMVPLTYNFNLLKGALPSAEIQMKLGVAGQLNFVGADNTGSLPAYEVSRWSNGFTFGVSAYLFRFRNNHKLGFYLDGYRGTQIYEDFYNLSEYEVPGSSYMKFGLKYQFN